MKFAALNGVSVAFLNLSLGFNSVGFYQMTKLAIIPCTVGIQTAFYAKRFSGNQASLAVLLLGVAAATVTDVRLNFWAPSSRSSPSPPPACLRSGPTPCRGSTR